MQRNLAGNDHAQAGPGPATDLTSEITMTICELIGEGRSLRSICAEAGMPNRATVFRWRARNPDFLAMYRIAAEGRNDDLLIEPIAIADACALDPGSIPLAKLRISARMSELRRMSLKKSLD